MSANKYADALTPLQLACVFFGTNADEELYEAVKQSSAARLDEFLQCYRDFAASSLSKTPPLEPGTLRPYLRTNPIGNNPVPWLWGAFNLGVCDFDGEDAVWKNVDEIKHRLLYCHSVAVEDPFGMFLESARRDSLHPNDVERNKARFLNYINFLIHLKPLIERHILCFIAPDYFMKRRPEPPPLSYLFREFSKELTSLPPPDFDEFRHRAPRRDKMFKPESLDTLLLELLKRIAVKRIDAMFTLLASAPSRLSPYFPFRYDIKLISLFQDQMRLTGLRRNGNEHGVSLQDVPDRDNRLLTELVQIDLPGIASLSPQDIVNIRRGDAFEEWRNTLKIGLQRASELDEDLLDFDKAARAVVTEAIRPAYSKLQDEFKKSTFLGKVGSASTTLVCGAIGGFAGYLVDPNIGGFVGALTGSFSEASAELIMKWSKNRGKTPSEVLTAAKRHYVALLG